MLELTTDMTEVVTLGPPGVTVMVGIVVVTAEPPIVAERVVAVPDTTPVKVAVYVPFDASDVALIEPVEVPPALANTIAEPPLVSAFPAASFAVRVNVTAEPLETVGFDTVSIEVAGEIAPGITVTVGAVEVMLEPPTLALIVVAVPDVTPVKFAV